MPGPSRKLFRQPGRVPIERPRQLGSDAPDAIHFLPDIEGAVRTRHVRFGAIYRLVIIVERVIHVVGHVAGGGDFLADDADLADVVRASVGTGLIGKADAGLGSHFWGFVGIGYVNGGVEKGGPLVGVRLVRILFDEVPKFGGGGC